MRNELHVTVIIFGDINSDAFVELTKRDILRGMAHHDQKPGPISLRAAQSQTGYMDRYEPRPLNIRKTNNTDLRAENVWLRQQLREYRASREALQQELLSIQQVIGDALKDFDNGIRQASHDYQVVLAPHPAQTGLPPDPTSACYYHL